MVLDQSTIEWLVFGGVLLGTLGRTFLPYIKAFKEAEETGDKKPFERHYLWTFIFAVVTGLAISLPIWTSLVGNFAPTSSIAAIIIASATSGWGVNDGVNRFVSARKAKPKKAPPAKEDPALTDKLLGDSRTVSKRDGES